MPQRTKIMLGLTVAVAAVAGVVVAVQMDDNNPTQENRQAVTDVLEVIPAATTNFIFVDRDAVATRLDLDELAHDATPDEVVRYRSALPDEAGVTPLAMHLSANREPCHQRVRRRLVSRSGRQLLGDLSHR